MGTSREYKCPQCDYKEVVSGGSDAGMIAAVKTHICKDCLILTDVVTMWFWHDDPDLRHKEIDPANYECEECGGHNLQAWDSENQPCPKCGARMKTNGGIEILWD